MKKNLALFVLALAGATLTTTSCNKKKDWNCNCTTVAFGQTSNSSSEINNQTKSDAEDNCDQIEAQKTTSVSSSTCTVSER